MGKRRKSAYKFTLSFSCCVWGVDVSMLQLVIMWKWLFWVRWWWCSEGGGSWDDYVGSDCCGKEGDDLSIGCGWRSDDVTMAAVGELMMWWWLWWLSWLSDGGGELGDDVFNGCGWVRWWFGNGCDGCGDDGAMDVVGGWGDSVSIMAIRGVWCWYDKLWCVRW
jgi:hypothetical protein